MSKVKVVLHTMSGQGVVHDSIYGTTGHVRRALQKKTGVDIDFVSFCGQYLDGETLTLFLNECKDAQVVITDAWNHPLNNDYINDQGWKNPEQSMANVVSQIALINPQAKIFSQLLEGVRKVAVHQHAEPHTGYTDDVIVEAIKQRVVKEGKPRVLVFDDSELHRRGAIEQLGENNLTVVSTYDDAQKQITFGQFDYVLLDLLVLASAKNQGKEGQKFV